MNKFNKQKAFGQHFLVDHSIIQGIIDETKKTLERNPRHALLEIGPGKGAITIPLMKMMAENTSICSSFIVAERDRELIEYWKAEQRIHQLLEGDFLEHSEHVLESLEKFVVVSNLPYSAGTAIVVKLCERSRQIPEMILMFQAEVAKRLYAAQSTPDRGSLSLYVQNEWDVKKIMTVKPQAFNPPPKVMSEVVTLKRRLEPFIALPDQKSRERWSDLLKTAFAHRRKMLRAHLGKTHWGKALERSGVDPTLRAEALEWKDWIAIWESA